MADEQKPPKLKYPRKLEVFFCSIRRQTQTDERRETQINANKRTLVRLTFDLRTDRIEQGVL